MSPSDQFQALAREWAEHCNRLRFSSILADYLNHPAYRALVQFGPAAIPWIVERYRADTLPWAFVLQEITGVRMIENPNEFSPAEVKRRWLAWWEEKRRTAPGKETEPIEADARS